MSLFIIGAIVVGMAIWLDKKPEGDKWDIR